MTDFKTKYQNIKNAKRNLDQISSINNEVLQQKQKLQLQPSQDVTNVNVKHPHVVEPVNPTVIKNQTVQSQIQQNESELRTGRNLFRNLKKRVEVEHLVNNANNNLTEKRQEIIKSEIKPIETENVVFHEELDTPKIPDRKTKPKIAIQPQEQIKPKPPTEEKHTTEVISARHRFNVNNVNNIKHTEIPKNTNINNTTDSNNTNTPNNSNNTRRNSLYKVPLPQMQVPDPAQEQRRRYSIVPPETQYIPVPDLKLVPTKPKTKIIENRLFKTVNTNGNIDNKLNTLQFLTSKSPILYADQLQNLPQYSDDDTTRSRSNSNSYNSINNTKLHSPINIKVSPQARRLSVNNVNSINSIIENNRVINVKQEVQNKQEQDEEENDNDDTNNNNEEEEENDNDDTNNNNEEEEDNNDINNTNNNENNKDEKEETQEQEEDDIFVDLESVKDPDFVIYKMDRLKELESLFNIALSYEVNDKLPMKEENYLNEEEEEAIVKQIADIHFYMKMGKYKSVYTKCTELLDINTNDKKEYISYNVYKNSHIYNLYRFYIWYILTVSSAKCGYYRNTFIGLYNFINYAPQKFYDEKFVQIAEILDSCYSTNVDFNKELKNEEFGGIVVLNHSFGSPCELPDNFDLNAITYCAYTRRYGINNLNVYPVNLTENREFKTIGNDLIPCRINAEYKTISDHQHKKQVGVYNSVIYMHSGLSEIYDNSIEMLYDLGEKNVIYDDDKIYAVLSWHK